MTVAKPVPPVLQPGVEQVVEERWQQLCHALLNPLAAAMGASETLLAEPGLLPREGVELAGILSRSLQRMARIIDDSAARLPVGPQKT